MPEYNIHTKPRYEPSNIKVLRISGPAWCVFLSFSSFVNVVIRDSVDLDEVCVGASGVVDWAPMEKSRKNGDLGGILRNPGKVIGSRSCSY